jgi:hypothetical protein
MNQFTPHPITTVPEQVRSLPLTSSAITAASYDSRQRTLSIEFPDGTLYRYSDVPLLTYEELITATSKGEYFNRRIRPRFRHTFVPAADHRDQ